MAMEAGHWRAWRVNRDKETEYAASVGVRSAPTLLRLGGATSEVSLTSLALSTQAPPTRLIDEFGL
jgi:hypothetical protein